MFVDSETADLRVNKSMPAGGKDKNQLTQLLQGEPVDVLREEGAWVYVEAVQQKSFVQTGKWRGYLGWVLKADLTGDPSAETVLHPTPSSELRGDFLQNVRAMVGRRVPYVWGGRSPEGLDCSGLVNWALRESGYVSPRDSVDIFLASTDVDPRALRPGDLIFFSVSNRPARIYHVMVYSGGDRLLESVDDDAHESSLSQRLGRRPADAPFAGMIKDAQGRSRRAFDCGSLGDVTRLCYFDSLLP
jgi:hypothetical protein